MSFKFPLLLLVIALAAGLTWWLREVREGLHDEPEPKQIEGPDSVLNDATLTVMNADGRRQYRLQTPRLEHFEQDRHAELEQPRMHYYRPGEPPLRLRSQRAWVGPRGERIELLGAVHMLRPEHDQRAPLTLETRNVTVRTGPQTAVTDERALMVSGASHLRGVGMHADLAAGTVNLMSEVRGTYAP